MSLLHSDWITFLYLFVGVFLGQSMELQPALSSSVQSCCEAVWVTPPAPHTWSVLSCACPAGDTVHTLHTKPASFKQCAWDKPTSLVTLPLLSKLYSVKTHSCWASSSSTALHSVTCMCEQRQKNKLITAVIDIRQQFLSLRGEFNFARNYTTLDGPSW